jgi:hypothetical protein
MRHKSDARLNRTRGDSDLFFGNEVRLRARLHRALYMPSWLFAGVGHFDGGGERGRQLPGHRRYIYSSTTLCCTSEEQHASDSGRCEHGGKSRSPANGPRHARLPINPGGKDRLPDAVGSLDRRQRAYELRGGRERRQLGTTSRAATHVSGESEGGDRRNVAVEVPMEERGCLVTGDLSHALVHQPFHRARVKIVRGRHA